MDYYRDEYLERLTESEPFGGWKLEETNESTTQKVSNDENKENEEQKIQNDLLSFVHNTLKSENGYIFFYKDKKIFFHTLIHKGNTYCVEKSPSHKDNAYFNITSTLKNNGIKPQKNGQAIGTYTYILYSDENTDFIKKTLKQFGFDNEIDTKSSRWKTVGGSEQRINKRGMNTEVADSLINAGHQQGKMGWMGTGYG